MNTVNKTDHVDTDDSPSPVVSSDETPEGANAEAPAAVKSEAADAPDRPVAEVVGTDPRALRSRQVRLGALVVAALVLCSGLFAWWQTSNNDALLKAQTRDAVLVATSQNIQTMNTLDYRKVDAGLKAWAAATTGMLHDQLTGISAEDRKLLADQKKISTGKVVDAAMIKMDNTSATVIASVEITVKDDANPDAKPTVKRNRFSADLLKVGGLWKLESLQQVAVNLK